MVARTVCKYQMDTILQCTQLCSHPGCTAAQEQLKQQRLAEREAAQQAREKEQKRKQKEAKKRDKEAKRREKEERRLAKVGLW